MTDREEITPTPPTYEVRAVRFAGIDEGETATLPAGWVPLGAVRQGEWVLILCYLEKPS